MAKLQKLSIAGIRSFSPEDIQQIKFGDTVTLFVGQNGSGKTSILESIKYALTGEIPAGCGPGAGFVNDPSLTGRMESRGQVRLKLKDVNGREIIIIRSNQVVKQRNGALKFSTLDSSVNQVNANEQPIHFSGRCADINVYCAEAIQVSPCILNNVLLCHQENSLWPLDEGKKLKEKFDEIFDSTKYNKCVDLLRKAWKAKNDRIKLLNKDVEYRKENHERIEKEKRKLQDKKNDLESKERSINEQKTELAPIETRIREIISLEGSFSKLEKDLASKEATKKGLVEQQKTIKRNITAEFTGTDEELNDKIHSFGSDQIATERKIRDLEKKKQEIESKEKEMNMKVQKLQMKMGQLKEEKRQYEHRCVERKGLIEKAKIYLKVSNISQYDIENNVDSVIENLKEALLGCKEELDNKIMEKAGDEAALQGSIDEIRDKQASMKQNIKSKNELASEYEKKVREITNHLHDLKMSDSQLKNVNSKIENIDKTIRSLKESFDEDEAVSNISKGSSEIEEMERKKTKLDQEYRLLQENRVYKDKLDSTKETVVQKQTEISKLKSKHSRNFEKLFGQSENIPSPLKEAVRSSLEKEERALKLLQTKLNDKQKEVTTLESKLQYESEKLKFLESDLQSKQKKVHSICKNKSFDDVFEQVNTKRESLQKDKAACTSLKAVYEQFITKFQDNSPCCPVCKTNFTSNTSMVKKIISDLKSEIERVPKSLPVLESELKKTNDLYNKLQQLKPISDSILSLSNAEIPLLQESLEEIRSSLEEAKKELSVITKEMMMPQEKIDVCNSLITDAAFLDQFQIDIENAEMMIEEIESQFVHTSSSKSVQEIEAELDSITLDITDLRKKVDTYKKKLEQHRNRLQDQRESKNKLVEKQLNFQSALQGKPEKEKQLAEYKEKIELLKSEMAELDSKLQLISNELKESVLKKEIMVGENAKAIEQLRGKYTSNQMIVEEVTKLQETINAYVQSNKSEAISSAEEELTRFQQIEENLSSTKDKVLQAIANKSEELAKQETRFREFKDNLTLREKQKEENALNVEITELKQQIGEHNLTSVLQEKRTLEMKYGKINRDINVISGQYDQIKQQIKELELELNKPANRNAFDDYRSKFYEVSVESVLVRDLEKYIAALEKSILEFHKDKMKQINKSVREHWRNIYRGNDVDYIEIKTEESSGNMNKRSYNYKVVQVKRGAELEMRGRCSAGQKVLACLVIRIALAEIFSSKCGILALDEPTTNLDHENIRSLSDALSKIVADRQQEANFQLLIITHDEDFLDTLNRTQAVSSFYKVSRNQNGFSVITRQHLH